MGFKFVVTGQLIPHEIGAEVEFAEMPHESLMHRLRPVDGSELVVATPQAEPEAEPEGEEEVAETELTEQVEAEEVAEAELEAEKPTKGVKR